MHTIIDAWASTPKYPLKISITSNTHQSKHINRIDGPPIFIYDFNPYKLRFYKFGHYICLFISGNIKLVYELYAIKTTKFMSTPAIPVPLIPSCIWITKYQLIAKWKIVPINKQKKGMVVTPKQVRNLLLISICPIINSPGKNASIYSWA